MKKAISVLLLVLVCAALFVGCEDGKNVTSEQQQATASASVSTASSGSQTASKQEKVINYTVNPATANKNLTTKQQELVISSVKAADSVLNDESSRTSAYDLMLGLIDRFKVNDSTPKDVSSVKTDMTMLYIMFSPTAQLNKGYILEYRNNLAAAVGIEVR